MTRRPLILAIAATALLAGCGQNNEASTSSTNTVAATPAASATSEMASPTGGSSAPSASMSNSAGSQTPHKSMSQKASAPLPKSSGEYADAAIDAVTKRDRERARRFFDSSAFKHVDVSKMPTDRLIRTACEDDMCSYSSESGKRVTFRFDMAKVKNGADKAITSVKLG